MIFQDIVYQSNIEDYIYDSSDSEYEEYYDAVDVAPQPFKKLATMLEEDESNETISATWVVNKCEVLLAIFKFALAYALPHSGIADLCRMFNTFLDTPVIPDSRYLLDKVFYDGSNIHYHAVCPTCKDYIGEFQRDQRTTFCQICELDVNLKNPCYRDFFITFDVSSDFKDLIESNAEYYNDVIYQREEAIINGFHDIYDGRKYKDFVQSLPENQKKSYATATLNSDGSPIFKSSKFSIWPIQVIINEVPLHERNQKPMVYSLWFGHDKPKMTYFLRPFVAHLNSLSKNGVSCTINDEIKEIHLYCICCCVDSVARAPMQGLKQFNGSYGCNWCLHAGEQIMHIRRATTKYPVTDVEPTRRDHANTKLHMQQSVTTNAPVFGVKNVSPLILLKGFDVIDGFVPDYMHCIDLGVVKQFTEYWFGTGPYSIPSQYSDVIVKTLEAFKVPTQLCRLSRSIHDRKYWKSKEWENWLLYYSLPLLAEIPNFDKYMKHWARLVEAAHILLRESISANQLNRARTLLREFVTLTQDYYTADAMTFNVHQLTHMADSVEHWGPLWAHCGYPFESGNGKILEMVHGAKGVLNQICRNLSRCRSVRMLQKHVALRPGSAVTGYCYYLDNRCTAKSDKYIQGRYFAKRYLPIGRQVLMVDNDFAPCNPTAYDKLVKDKSLFKSCNNVCNRSNNSFAQTEDGSFIQIVQFIVDGNNELTVFKKIDVLNCFSEECTTVMLVRSIDDNESIIETRKIKKLCVFMSVGDKQYISAVPNMYWYS